MRSQDFGDGLVGLAGKFCSKEHHAKNQKSGIRGGDVLIAAIGATIGAVGFVPTATVEANTNQNIARVRMSSLSANAFLWSFLCSRFGQFQLRRLATGNAQPYLNSIQIKRILVPWSVEKLFDAKIVADFEARRIESETLYSEAQQLLESELGLDKVSFEKPVAYTARFSEIAGNGRNDADYFQPKYRQLDTLVAKYPVARIKSLSEKLETGIYSASYTQNGRPYIRGTDLSGGFIEENGILRSSAIRPTVNAVVNEGDILVTRVGSIGVCGIVEHDFSGSFFSDNLIRIRLNEDRKKTHSPHCLNLLLNTTYGQMQMLRYSRGSVQQRLNQSQLAQIPIPCIPWDAQQEIEKLLLRHRTAKKASISFLNQAKARVEQLIEECVKS